VHGLRLKLVRAGAGVIQHARLVRGVIPLGQPEGLIGRAQHQACGNAERLWGVAVAVLRRSAGAGADSSANLSLRVGEPVPRGRLTGRRKDSSAVDFYGLGYLYSVTANDNCVVCLSCQRGGSQSESPAA
jgi:hypothetical protein